MSCRISEDDKCQHGIPLESVDMHDCPHDGFRCSPCGHPACHNVTFTKRRRPHLDTQHRAVCTLCRRASTWTDLDGAREWETAHMKAVAK